MGHPRENQAGPGLRERAAAAKASAERVMRREPEACGPQRDLSAMTVRELSFLGGAVRQVAGLMELIALWAALGQRGQAVIEAELCRLDQLRGEISGELETRTARTAHEVDDRTAVLIHEWLDGRDWADVAAMADRAAREAANLRSRA